MPFDSSDVKSACSDAPSPHSVAVSDSRAMSSLPFNCAAILWAMDQQVSSASASRLLIEIARRSSAGKCAATQADLGRACMLSERQTRTLLAALVHDGAIVRTRNGGVGKGRVADGYEMVGYVEESTTCELPAISAASLAGNRQYLPVEATGNRQSSPVAKGATGNFDRKNLPVAATGNEFPPHPPIRTTSTVGDKPSNTEVVANRGPGEDLFGEAKPKRKSAGTRRRPKREKFYASEETMPHEPNEAMAEYAAAKHLINGTRAEQFGKFRRWHIRQQTLIASLEGRWETWVDNWAKDNPVRPSGAGTAPPGYTFAGIGPDGKPRYNKDHRTNVYR